MRGALLVFAVAAYSTTAAGDTPPAPVPASAPAPIAAPLSEAMAQPYFQSGDAKKGATEFALQRYKEARTAFEAARKTAKGDDAARLDVMLGLCNEEIGNWSRAAQQFASAQQGLPLLSDYLGFHRAKALYFNKQGAEALAAAQKVAADSIVGADAELLAGDVLRGMNDPAKTAAHYKDYLTRRPDGPRRSEARFRQAEALEAAKLEQAEAMRLYRQITIDDPLSSWAKKATERLATLAPKALEALTAAEHITRGKELFDSMRNPESEAAFASALADPKISAADKCIAAYHRGQSRFKARDRKGAAPMFEEAAEACKAAANKDLEIKSHYQAGRSRAFIGEHQTAITAYQTAQKIDPKHSYSDDALLREGEEWTSLKDEKKVIEVLSSLPKKFPAGDNVAEAMWRLGWQAWKAKKYDDSIKWWKKQIELVPHDDNYFGEGQAQYWLGRAYQVKGKKDDAIASWEAGIRQYPVAYYALQGLNRLREVSPGRYEKLVAELSADPKGFDPKAPAFTFSARPEWAAPGFQRAMELLRLGLGQPAEAELKKLKLTPPGDKKRVDDPATIEKLWAIAFLYDKAGRYATSHWPTRWHVLDYRRSWPNGANRSRWLIAYPLAYEELLRRHAQLNSTPFAMQIGIVREESAFDPRTESYANAWGLTQMIPPTAKDFSKGTNIAPTRENMFDPEMNVTVGGRFLGHLFKRYSGFALLVPPGYNAGPGAVRRMLKVRGTWAADEFIEGIVDDQARNYSKRVLGTYFTYSWLYEKTVPTLPLKIPTELLPKP
ncbi:MAG: transglycosylase SLT domain-containing protein [Deltaproteobacteria bacterium]|nr:transglycosylase SLT domain-containing protein [Deltaproteobacteria bacterium]